VFIDTRSFLFNEEGGPLETRIGASFLLENYQSNRIVPSIGRREWCGKKCDLVNHVGEPITRR
jgi:hypothetical protein